MTDIVKKEDKYKTERKELKEFVNEFKDESDRATVIIGAAKLDNLLYQLLHKFFLPNTSNTDDLLDGYGPLSTFSARTLICHRLGFITPELTHSLHLLRKIRNDFAHEVSGCDLNFGPHKDRVKALSEPFQEYEAYHKVKEHYFKDKSEASADFRVILAILCGRLLTTIKGVSALKMTNPVDIVPPAWKKESQ